MSRTRPRDHSQPERTVLAWQRTALSLAVAAALSAKALLPWLGPPGVGVAALGVLGAAGIWAGGGRRYRSAAPPDGRALALTAALTTAAGFAAVLFVLTPSP